MRRALVFGAGGFIGSHLVKRLAGDGIWVRGVDLKQPDFSPSAAEDFVVADLRDPSTALEALDRNFDEVYQLAADMGGAEFIFTGENDADILHNSALINLNVLDAARRSGNVGRIFYASSACVYPEHNQLDPDDPRTDEASAYPAAPDSEYGWEKLFSERLYFAFARNHGLVARVARYHNVFGPEGTWTGGREKAPAALCRKVAEAIEGDSIEIFGDGLQTRSFLYVEEALEGTLRLMRSDFAGPVNIGSSEKVTINELALSIASIAEKTIRLDHIRGPLGVRGRSSDNRLIHEQLGWRPTRSLRSGLSETYRWIEAKVRDLITPPRPLGA